MFAIAGHPVTWMGRLIAALDHRWNREDDGFDRRRWAGIAALAVLLVVVAASSGLVVAVVDRLPAVVAVLVTAVLASSCLAQRSLHEHVAAVATALATGDIAEGRVAVARIVGRDTSELDEAGVARAAIESLAENFCDGVVAPVFWLAVGGLPGGMLMKAVNTADSMIGHRTPRHVAFGFAAAKLDDAVIWPAARLAAVLIVAAAALTPAASARSAWRVMRRDARGHASPNAGWPEAAMAGALTIRLGGTRNYNGQAVADRPIGDGTAPVAADTIRRALQLYRVACCLQLALLALLALVLS